MNTDLAELAVEISKRQLFLDGAEVVRDDVLLALDEETRAGSDLYTWAKTLTRHCGYTLPWVKVALSDLREQGMASFARGLMDDDGDVAGSGYCITEKGAIKARLIRCPRD